MQQSVMLGGWISGVGGNRGAIGDVHPHVHVGRAPEVPDEGGALQPPVVPHAVVAEIGVLLEGEPATVETALGGEAATNLVAIDGAVRLEQHAEHSFEFRPLVDGKV